MPIHFKNLSVLVVEDNQHMRRIVAEVLKTLGVGKILQADSGTKALQVIRNEHPDMIISDWQMEPMDGLELAELIRNDAKNPARLVPIIMMTGYSAHERVTEARDKGVTEFLIKPFTAEALAKRIVHVINQPRDFVVGQKFKGPDRRRRSSDDYRGPTRRERDHDHT